MSITNIIKYNRAVYNIYYFFMSGCINILKLFVKTDDKLILFNSFGGRKYDDSPKEIFEQMRLDPRFNEYRMVWAFHKPEEYSVNCSEKINTNSLRYFVTALSARAWITNSSIERGLNFSGKNTFYFNTWHGTPIKLMGSDISTSNKSFKAKGKNHIDIMMSQGRFETKIFARTFGVPENRFLEAGLPRNDILSNYTESYRKILRDKLNLPADKKVILYCPTFREYEKDDQQGVIMAPPLDPKKWERELEDCILLVRAHYEVSKVMKLEESMLIRNMTDYPCLNDLLIAADILISDYSSVFFDYSITGKPMLHFTYDYDTYSAKRGMYFDIRQYIIGGSNEDEIIALIKNIDMDEESKRTVNFRSKYVNFFGHATESAIECILDNILK